MPYIAARPYGPGTPDIGVVRSVSNKPSMGPSLSDTLLLVNELKQAYNAHVWSLRTFPRMSSPHVVATVQLGGGTISLQAEFEGGGVWVFAFRKDPSRVDSASPSDQINYIPEKGWALQQSDPRNNWPRHTPLSLQGAVEHMLTYVAPTGPDRNEAYKLIEAALTEAIPSLDAMYVMDS